MFLDELPDPITDKTPEEDIECGPICLVERIKPADGTSVVWYDAEGNLWERHGSTTEKLQVTTGVPNRASKGEKHAL